MIKEPMQPIQRNIVVDLFKDAQESLDRFFVGRMKPERPAILGQKANHPLQFALEFIRKVRMRFKEIRFIRKVSA
jgi:hypothetical protein